MMRGLGRVFGPIIVAGLVLAGGMGAAAPARAYDANDPYDSGCINRAYIANSGELHSEWGADFAFVENWYSWGCNKNWTTVIFHDTIYASQIRIHTKGYRGSGPDANMQCYPTNCAFFYYGGQSPTWTDMIDGTSVDCVAVTLQGYDPNAPYHRGIAYSDDPVQMGGFGSYDALCA